MMRILSNNTIRNLNRIFLLLLLLLVIVLIAGCAAPQTRRAPLDDALVEAEAQKQREIALDTFISNHMRLQNVAYPLLVSAAELCDEKVHRSIGIIFANKFAFTEEFHDAAIKLYGMGEKLQVIHLTAGSPAELGGLEVGDVLVRINERPVPTGRDATKEFRELFREELKKEGNVIITIKRKSIEKEIELTPVQECDYPVFLSKGDEINAFADGARVVITRGMMRFVENDKELSMVVAHELAHNIMSHIDAKMQNMLLGSIVDILAAVYGINTQGTFGGIGAQVYSKEFEAEADYVGLYIMARAGLEIENTAMFWRRMAAEHPGNISRSHATTHPATPERFIGIEKTVEEIRKKQGSGLPLEPELKKE